MGGPAEIGGASYQEGVIAFIFVHAVANRRLAWMESLDDRPLAVSGETGGPGDDVLVEAVGLDFELQAKAGLTGEVAFNAAVRDIVARYRGRPEAVVLAVDRRSSTWIYNDVANDLERLRSGRSDFLARLDGLHRELGDDLTPVRTKALDVMAPETLDSDRARDLLVHLFDDSDTAAAVAWARLLEVAADVARRRLRKTRDDLIAALRSVGLEVPEIGPDARRMNELDFVRGLLDKRHAAAALATLAGIEHALPTTGVSPDVIYWLWKHRATAQLQLHRPEDARVSAARALDIKPDATEALAVAALASVRAAPSKKAGVLPRVQPFMIRRTQGAGPPLRRSRRRPATTGPSRRPA